MHSLPSDSSRRVLTRDDAIAVGRRLLAWLDEGAGGTGPEGITLEHTARAITKISNGRVMQTEDGDRVRIRVASQFGSGLPVEVMTNQLDDAVLRSVVARAAAMAPPVAPPEWMGAIDYSDQQPFTFQAREFPDVALWHDMTARASESAQETAIPSLVEQLRNSQLNGAATLSFGQRSVLYLYKRGLTAFADETDCEVTVTARTPDNAASGWAGDANRDWTKIQLQSIATRAADMASRSRGMVAVEPGRRTAILGAAAVAQLVRCMAREFDWNQTKEGGMGSPFTFLNHNSGGRHTKFGLRVFDPRLMMVSDPADPMGGYAPFFEANSMVEPSLHGFPTPAITWIDHGVLKHFAYSIADGLSRNMTPCEWPVSVRVMAVPGTPTATVDEMIANCKEGIYVNRFSNVELVDWPSGLMTGVTRDGCFLVKDGKIAKPVKNFRFTDSPFFSFNKLEMIGVPERAAFGTIMPHVGDPWGPWPAPPVIVPPMMVRDFNFSSTIDAV